MNVDDCGSFTELLNTQDCGQDVLDYILNLQQVMTLNRIKMSEKGRNLNLNFLDICVVVKYY